MKRSWYLNHKVEIRSFFTVVWQNQEALRKKNDEYNKTNHIFFRKRLPVRTQWQNTHQLFGKENCKSFFQLFATFSNSFLKSIFSKKATIIDEIFPVDLTLTTSIHNTKSMVNILSNFVAFLENMNFNYTKYLRKSHFNLKFEFRS